MRAAVIGAGGGIGRALVDVLARDASFERVHAFSRQPIESDGDKVVHGAIDVSDAASIALAAATIKTELNLVIVATGMLHDANGGPERALKDFDPVRLARSFAVNAIGPALVLRHFVPLLRRDGQSTIALLSARVGSISDNNLGGCYGYRASKAALNQIVRTAPIEVRPSRPQAICIALHPGTVDTALSQPFQRGVPSGKLFAPEFAAARLLEVLNGLTSADSGRLFAWDGKKSRRDCPKKVAGGKAAGQNLI